MISGAQIQLSDFVGEHGPYQLSISMLLFMRYFFLGLMANSGPLMTPDVTFYCNLPRDEIMAIMPNLTLLNQTEQELEIKEEFKRICQIDLHLYQQAYINESVRLFKEQNAINAPIFAGQWKRKFNATNRIRECTDFNYEIALDQGRTMTSEFDLVCDRDWLRSLFQSLISAAIVVAHVFWGTFSDKYGRFKAQKICLIVSLIAGGLSIFAVDFWTFVICRALCSFGDLGLAVSLTTTVVELVGNQYRGISVAAVNFGYALGVTILPYIVAYFEDFRLVVTFTVLCHLCTMPFIFTTNESIRWLLTNRKFHSAKKELKRLVRWNKRYYSCCSIWPLNVLFKPHIIGSGKEEHFGGGRKISAMKEKQAFEILFKDFIDQIESQNFCDPLGPTIVQPESPSATSGAINTSTEQTALTGCLDEQQQREEELEEIKRRLAETSNGQNAIVVNIEQCSNNHNEVDVNFNQVEVDETKNKLTLPLERPNSCANLSIQLSIQPESKEENPLNVSQDFRDAHFIRAPGQQPDCINIVASQLSFVGRVSRLFKDKKLMIVVFTIVWTTFNSELQYTSFIIINLEVGEDVYLNYILGGCMEALAAIIASLLLSYAPRRHSLITFWLLISLSCFGLSVAHIDSTWAVWLLALAKFSQSCLSSIASVAAYESFPTFLRQSGSGLVFTLGMLGSVFAPLIFAEFDDHAGMDRVLMTFSLSSLTAAILIYLYLRETKNCELN